MLPFLNFSLPSLIEIELGSYSNNRDVQISKRHGYGYGSMDYVSTRVPRPVLRFRRRAQIHEILRHSCPLLIAFSSAVWRTSIDDRKMRYIFSAFSLANNTLWDF
mgnify:CR=1 FL=1